MTHLMQLPSWLRHPYKPMPTPSPIPARAQQIVDQASRLNEFAEKLRREHGLPPPHQEKQ